MANHHQRRQHSHPQRSLKNSPTLLVLSKLKTHLSTEASVVVQSKPYQSVPIPHHIFDGTQGWMRVPAEPHPTIHVTVSSNQSDYDHLRLPFPKMSPVSCSVVVDSGCQSALLGVKTFNKLGLKKSCLVPVKGGMCTISKEGIQILGAVFLRLKGVDNVNGQTVETAVMAYVSDCTEKFYISRQVMRELGIIPPDFPKITAPETAAV